MEVLGTHKDASSVINVRSFIANWDESVIPGIDSEPKPIRKEMALLATEMGVPVETIKELADVCGESTLHCGGEKTDIDMLQNIPEDIPLMTLRYRKQELEKRKRDPTYRSLVSKNQRYKMHDAKLMINKNDQGPVKIPEEYLVQHPDVILTVNVMFSNIKTSAMKMFKTFIDQTFLVLGCEKLTDLRDKISCVNDLSVAGDFSSNPDGPGFYAKDIYKSGYFYIEGSFYNDLREPECRDNSQMIIDWAQNTNQGFGPLKNKSMEDMTFLDLNVRLGQPYLFSHQGDCEHMLIFSDIRLLSKDDVQDIREYPRLIKKRRVKRTKCRVCQMHAARWVTENSEHTPENPCFFCDQCFRALHYDENGEKLGDFEAYRFFDCSAVI